MNAPDWLIEELKNFDPQLRARFDDGPRPDVVVYRGQSAPRHRWVIERFSPVRQRWVRVLTWTGPDGEFIPFDRRIFHVLAEMDTWRYGGDNCAVWKAYGRKRFMENGGMKHAEGDAFMEPWEKLADRRYHEQAAVLSEEFLHILKRDPHYQSASGQDEKDIRQYVDDLEEVSLAKKMGRGILERHPEKGYTRVRPGSLQ